MALLHQLRDWAPRFRLLFPHPTPTVANQLDKNLHRLERWLVRKSRELGVPSTIEEATDKISAAFANLRALTEFLSPDEHAVRLTVDTNTLIDNPDLTAHVSTLGSCYQVHLLPVVLREIDNLKRDARTQEVREAAKPESTDRFCW
jgi:hypothetical protein